MTILDHKTQPQDKWRDGVMTEMRVSALVQSKQLTEAIPADRLFTNEFVPGA